jgi:hypothetical protein
MEKEKEKEKEKQESNKKHPSPVTDKKPIIPTASTSINTSSLKKEETEEKPTIKSTPSTVVKSNSMKPDKKIEGTIKGTIEGTKEGYENIHTSLLPSFYGTERDKIIHLEKIIRPKPSNSFLIMQSQGNTSNAEPMSFYYGKNKEPFANMASV